MNSLDPPLENETFHAPTEYPNQATDDYPTSTHENATPPAPKSRSTTPENDIFTISTTLIPVAQTKSAGTTSISFSDLLNPPLYLHEDLREGCGGQLWPAGMVLAQYLLQHQGAPLRNKTTIEIGAGGGLVGLAAARGGDLGNGSLLITDQEPMLSLMQKNILLNDLSPQVSASIYDWGTAPPPEFAGEHPDVVLAADCVYFEPAFPLLLHTLTDLIGPATTCYFCFKKRRKADMRFIRDMQKRFECEAVEYEDRERDQREGIHLFKVTRRRKTKKL